MRRSAYHIIGVLLLGSVAGAQAADLQQRPVFKPAVPVPAFTWTGLYVGAHGGYAWGRDTTKEYISATMGYVGLQNTFKPDGFFGGLHAGANYQFRSAVFGIEGDVDLGSIKGGFVDPPVAPFNPGGRGNTEIGIQGSMRLRLGYAFGPALAYATGGIAAAELKSTYYNWPGTGETFKRNIYGYTVGGGLEYAFTSALSARVEYRFTQFDLTTNNSQLAFPGFSGTQEPYYHTTRAGLSYRF
jgi:outer membrane immunogenic protein